MPAVATVLSTDPRTDSSPTPKPDERRGRALLIACITIALERFGFYTLVSLFVLYLVDHRGQSEAQANTWYGVMMGATYFTPLFGGALADRFGRWLCIGIGAFLLAVAYGLLTAGFLPLSILLLSIGMGLFKGNITAAVGSLYSTERESMTSPSIDSIGLSTWAHSQPVSCVAGSRSTTATPLHSYLPQVLVCSRGVCGCSQVGLCSASIHTPN